MSNIQVGYSSRMYAEQRNIIGRVPEAEYVLLHDIYSVLRRLREMRGTSWLFPEKARDAEFKFWDLDLNQVDILHFFNAISFGKRPWISTFETIIPRYSVTLSCRDSDPERICRDPEVLRALEALCAPSCKNIVALSQCTAQMQSEFLRLFPSLREEILGKQIVLPSPQSVSCTGEHIQGRSLQEDVPLRFLLVGHQFFRKGGREILQVLDEGRRTAQWPVELVVVSNLQTDGYATCTGAEDVAEVRRFIAAHADWITYYPSLPYEKVLKLMESCDVGLLPSYAETYGYSVLELQSKGCPVITTDIRSFPEINNMDVGWLIPVPKRADGEAKYREPGGRQSISLAISNGLNSIISEIFENRAIIMEKGLRALKRIENKHSPERYAKSLLKIYQAAIAG